MASGNDGSGSFLGLVLRAARLDSAGVPVIGANAVYVTKFVQMQSNAELHTGKDIEKEAADGTNCLTAKLPDFQKRKTVNLNLCVDDPELTWLLVGGELLRTSQLLAPSGVTATPSSTGGSLTNAHGAYGYRVTALDSHGETLPGSEVTATVAAGTSGSVAVAWSAVTGAVSYNVYGRTVSGELKLNTSAVTGTTFTDTGAATPSGALPTANTTGLTQGWEEPPVGAPGRPYGVCLEWWTYAWLGGAQVIDSNGDPVYKHHWLGKALLTLGDRQFSSDASDFPFTGFAEENPNLGDGPGHDIPTGGNRLYGFVETTTLPTVAVGLQAGS